MRLSADEQAMLAGERGEPRQWAIKLTLLSHLALLKPLIILKHVPVLVKVSLLEVN